MQGDEMKIAFCSGLKLWAASALFAIAVGIVPIQSVLAAGSGVENKSRPDFNGVWQPVKPVKQIKTIDGKAPPLLPDAQKIYDQHLKQYQAGNTSFDPTTQCKPMGLPRTAYDGWPFEILQNETQLLFGYTWNRMVRFVPFADEFSDYPGPLYYGRSIAKWEGDTLVLTVRAITAGPVLDASGMPHSDALELTERYRLKNPNTLEQRIVFTDPKTFSSPWESLITYKRLPGAQIAEDFCLERLKITLKAPEPGTPVR